MSAGQSHVFAAVNTGGRVYSTGGVARLVGVSQQTVIRECDRGSLICYRVPGSKFRRITRAELLAWAERHGIPLNLADPTDTTRTTEATGHDVGTGETERGAGDAGPAPGEQEADGGRVGGESEDALQPAEPLGD